MVPAVLVTEKGDPLAVRRRPGLRARFAPVGDAPEFFFRNFVNGARFSVGGVRYIDEVFFEVAGLAVEDEMRGVNPCEAAVFSGSADGDGLAAGNFARVDLAGDIFFGAIEDFCSRVGRRLVVMNDFAAGGVAEG